MPNTSRVGISSGGNDCHIGNGSTDVAVAADEEDDDTDAVDGGGVMRIIEQPIRRRHLSLHIHESSCTACTISY